MGWCSATEIMDTALKAAEAAVRAVLDTAYEDHREEIGPVHEALEHVAAKSYEAEVDKALRPFVATIAEQLRDGDWDCIEESAYFDRFPREMLGLDDREWEEWLAEQIHENHDRAKRLAYMRMLEEFYGGKASDG